MTRTRQQIIEDTLIWVKHDLERMLPSDIEKVGYMTQDREVKKILRERMGHDQEFRRKYAFP